ncbi:MAG: carboxyltransferase domain-containing protein [Rhodobacteraceae bacterium]|nr:carboxyltransferase domain-containing protein [Paracoccaceae bacterium]
MHALGQDGVLLRFSLRVDTQATAAVQFVARALGDMSPAGVVDVVPALSSVLVRFDPARVTRDDIARHLRDLAALAPRQGKDLNAARRIWHIPAALGGAAGPDLAEAAAMAGLGPDAAIRQLAETPLRVLAIGFAPGQPYLGLLPDIWDIPRQTALTPRVEAGALVVALRQIVLFANPSPTGWRQIGLTAFRPFQPAADDPVPLRAGDEIRLSLATTDEIAALVRDGDPKGGARLEVTP